MLPEQEQSDMWATYAWVGLALYILAVDISLGATGHKYMTDAWREAMAHPIHRWVVICAWGFTTKHLFFGNLLPWLDPYHGIAAVVKAISKLKRSSL